MTERCPHCGARMITCSECGKIVPRTGANQKLCEDCREAVYQRRNQAYQAEYWKKKKLRFLKEDE